jgi:hypothetical protein
MVAKKKVPHLAMRFGKLGKTDATVCDRIGGSPNAWTDDGSWPICGFCKQPMRFLLQLLGTSARGKARIGKARALQLFICQSENRCAMYMPPAHSVAVRIAPLAKKLVHREGPADMIDGDRDDPLNRGRGIAYKAGADDLDALDDVESARFERAIAKSAISKLYGVPCSGNEPETPTCKGCKKPMAFLAQVKGVNDMFTFFLHACADCEQIVFQAER